MKLMRYGAKGAEKPALVDAQGTVRDLSGVIPDITAQTLTPAGLKRLAELDAAKLPAGRATRPDRAALERHGQVHLHRPQLLRPRRRDRLADPERSRSSS